MTGGPVPPSAREIIEQALAETGAAMMANDFARFAIWFGRPYTLIRAKGTKVCKTPDDLRSVFDTSRDHYLRLNTAQLVRIVREAEFVAPDHLRAVYESNLLSKRALRVVDPYICLTDMTRGEDGRWRVVRAQYNLPEAEARALVRAARMEV